MICPDCNATMKYKQIAFPNLGEAATPTVNGEPYCPNGCPRDGDINAYIERLDRSNPMT